MAVLNGEGAGTVRVSAQKRRLIAQIAEEKGYLPNSAARAIREGRFGAIGLLKAEDIHYSSSPGIMERGIHEELSGRDTHLVLGPMRDANLDDVRYLPRILRLWSVDGLLVDISTVLPRVEELVDKRCIPAIWLHAKRDRDAVFFDEVASFRQATEHLIGLGHRRLAYFGPNWPDGHYSVGDRRLGFEQAMDAAGLSGKLAGHQGLTSEELTSASRGLLSDPDRPTAVVCYSDGQAGALHMAALDMGLRVPRDLSLVCSGSLQSNIMCVAFTMMQLPLLEMGRLSVRMLMQKIADPALVLPPCALPAAFVPGLTATAPSAVRRRVRREV
jgi:DNA-binding LacI/PurR family transcriptional regulator